jgi:hypothetical protein
MHLEIDVDELQEAITDYLKKHGLTLAVPIEVDLYGVETTDSEPHALVTLQIPRSTK